MRKLESISNIYHGDHIPHNSEKRIKSLPHNKANHYYENVNLP